FSSGFSGIGLARLSQRRKNHRRRKDMHKKTWLLVLSLSIMTTGAWAQTETSTARDTALDTLAGPNDAALSITPQLGVLGFSDATGEYTSRFSEGLTLTWLPERVFDDPY